MPEFEWDLTKKANTNEIMQESFEGLLALVRNTKMGIW
jgi:hypothetical protein